MVSQSYQSSIHSVSIAVRTLSLILLTVLFFAGCKQEEDYEPEQKTLPAQSSELLQEEKIQESDHNQEQPSLVPPTPPATDNESSQQPHPPPKESSLAPRSQGKYKESPDQGASAQENYVLASRALKKANSHAKSEAYGEAYREALTGWQALRGYPNNDKCRELAVKLEEAMRDYGETLNNQAAGGANPGGSPKPFQVE